MIKNVNSYNSIQLFLIAFTFSILLTHFFSNLVLQDLGSYALMFEETPFFLDLFNYKFKYYNWTGVYGEWGYVFLMSIFKSFGFDFFEFRYIIIFLVVLLNVIWFHSLGVSLYYALPAYFLLNFGNDISLLRNGLAVVCLSWAFIFYNKFKMMKTSILLLLVGTSFHISVIIGIVFFGTRYLILFTLIFFAFFFNNISNIEDLVLGKLSRFYNLQGYDVGFMRFTVFFSLLTLISYSYWRIKYWNRLIDTDLRLFDRSFFISLFATFSLILFSFSQYLSDRLWGIGSIFILGLFSFICSKIRPNIILKLLYMLLIIVGIDLVY
tara:strand:+ start:185 stop:1153 length:969 start_codon:yes stop_codon:yes gene_type:complete